MADECIPWHLYWTAQVRHLMEMMKRSGTGKTERELGARGDDLLDGLQRLDSPAEVVGELGGDGGDRVGEDLLLDVLVGGGHRRRGVLVEVLGLRTQLSGR